MNFAALKKIKKLQDEMMATQKEIENTIFTASSGGVVSVDVKGNKELVSVSVDKSFVAESPEDFEMLTDMVVAACNLAYKQIEKTTQEKMGKYEALLGSMNGMF